MNKNIKIIKNNYLTVQVNLHGAGLWSVKDQDETEYLWQGDKAIWSGQSPILFPIVGRLMDDKYA